jgi:uncharacterized membrane protein
MIPDKILYTDGHDVTVTDSTFQVKNTSYSLKGIIKHGLMIVRPQRLPGILLAVLGVVIAICGFMYLFPGDVFGNVQMNGEFVNSNTIFMWIGVAIILLSILVIALMRERYAVRIATAEGERNAVVSHRKEYVAQIIGALNEAMRFARPGATKSFITVK